MQPAVGSGPTATTGVGSATMGQFGGPVLHLARSGRERTMRGMHPSKLTMAMRGLLGGPRGRPLLDGRRVNAVLRCAALVAVLCVAVLPARAD